MKIVLTVFVFLTACMIILPQTIIKEKVEIKPKAAGLQGTRKIAQNERGYTPCGPYLEDTDNNYWQVVWAGYHNSIDPRQQLFEKQGNLNLSSFMSDGPYSIAD